MTHPDIELFAAPSDWDVVDDMHRNALEAVKEAQSHGYHHETPTNLVTLLVEAVPFGAAMLLLDPMARDVLGLDKGEAPIEQIVEMVVPIAGRPPPLDSEPDQTNTRTRS
jgi:hypothetical protein